MTKIGIIGSVFFPLTMNAHQDYGGMEIRTISLIEYLSSKGHEVTVYAPRGSSLPLENVTIRSGNYPMWDGKSAHPYDMEKDLIRSNLSSLKKCDGILEDNHFHYLNYLHSKELWKNQAVMSWDFYPENLNVLPPHSRNVVAVSKWLRNKLREKFKNRGHNFYFAYSGINLDYYRKHIKDISFDGPILYLNRFSTIKGAHLYLQLAKEFPDEKFLMQGDVLFTNENIYAWKIKKEADSLPNLDVVFNVSWKEKIAALQNCKLMIHPCVIPEPLGFDCIEAQYFGKYVLGFGMGGLLETVKESKTGRLVPFSRTTDENMMYLKKGLSELLEMKANPSLCQKNVEENFDFKKLSAPVYEAILNGEDEDSIFKLQRKQNNVVI